MQATDDGEGSRQLTAHERARRLLRREILTGELPGGSRLIQTDVADRLGLSTTPVREALRDLATEGLVKFDAHRGAVVHSVDPAEMREIYEIRRRLEPLVAELAIERITDEQLDRARELHQQMNEEGNVTDWVELNFRFHMVFVDACESPRLASIVRSLHASASPYVAMTMRFRPDLMQVGNDDHADILAACERRDAAAAVERIVGHMDITKQVIENQSMDTQRQPRS